MPTPGAHEWEQADTRQLDDQSPRRPGRHAAQLHSPRGDICRRSAQMVMRLAVVPGVAVVVVLVCAPVPPPESAGTITAQPGRPSTARSSHAPGRPTNPLIRRKARPPCTAAAGGVYKSQATRRRSDDKAGSLRDQNTGIQDTSHKIDRISITPAKAAFSMPAPRVRSHRSRFKRLS